MSATPQRGCLSRACSSRTPSSATALPFKRRAAPFPFGGFDSQEWLRVSTSPSLHRLRCERTDNQPFLSTDEDTPGTAENTSDHSSTPCADGEGSSITEDRRDAHLLLQELAAQTSEQPDKEDNGPDNAQSGTLTSTLPEKVEQSISLGRKQEEYQNGEDAVVVRPVALGIEDETGLSVILEDTEPTAEAENGPETADSETGAEIMSKDRPEDRGQELQGTKIAAAPDLMASRPAMLSAPPESAEDEEGMSSSDFDGEPLLLGASPDDTEVGETVGSAGIPAEEPDGRSLSSLLPLKPGSSKQKVTAVSVTATPTTDGTMFSFEPVKAMKPPPKVPQKAPVPPVPSTAANIQENGPSSGVQQPVNIDVAQKGNTAPPGMSASTSRAAPSHAHGSSLDGEAKIKVQGRTSPSATPLERADTDSELDDSDVSGDDEFMLIQMEADDSVDAGTPDEAALQLPRQDWVGSDAPPVAAAGPSSPFNTAEPQGFFKDVDTQAAVGSAANQDTWPAVSKDTNLPSSHVTDAARPQTVRQVENATDTSTAVATASAGTAAAPASKPKGQDGSGKGGVAGAGAAQTGSAATSAADQHAQFSAMKRGAGSVRHGPRGSASHKIAGVQSPKIVQSGGAAPDAPTSAADPSAAGTARSDGLKDAPGAAAEPADVSGERAFSAMQQGTAPVQPSSTAAPPPRVAVRPSGNAHPLQHVAGAGETRGVAEHVNDKSDGQVAQSSSVQSHDHPTAVSSVAAGAETEAPVEGPRGTDGTEGSGIGALNRQQQGAVRTHVLDGPPGPIRSHSLNDTPPATAEQTPLALVRQQHHAHGSFGHGRSSSTPTVAAPVGAAAAGEKDGAEVIKTPEVESSPVDTPEAARAANEISLPRPASVPEMPDMLRQSSKPAGPRHHDPPTDAASAIAIQALAGAAAGIPPSGPAKGFSARRRRRRGRNGANNSGTATPSRSALASPDVLRSEDVMVSVDPDDAGRDFTPPPGNEAPAQSARAPASPPPNGARSELPPAPLPSGPPLEDPPEALIHPFHLTLFAVLLIGAVAFAITVINFTTDMGWLWSAVKVFRKLAKSLAFRQSIALMVAIAFVRYGLEPLVRSVRSVFSLPGPWERSTEFFILKQVYQPLEFLLFVAAISTVVEAVLPPLVAVQKETVRIVVRTMLSLTYVIASAFVVFNIKARIVQEKRWRAELSGDTAAQRSIEATNKLLTVLFLFVATLLGLQAIGLDIQSVLAISGFGGLALGLAGREILENVFNGLLIVSSRSFVVGEEIMFTQSGHAGRIIEGIIMDIGWYRTLIRSFEREIYIVPNSVFSRTVVLNVTRKGKEWRVFENIGVRVEDISAVPSIIGDMRRIIRNDVRVLPKLHRRVFLDKVNRNELVIYISFYIEAANRDAYMATKQEIFLEFALACERHGAQLASNRHQVQLVPNLQNSGAASLRLLSDASLDPDLAHEEDELDADKGADAPTDGDSSDEDGESPTYYLYRDP